MSDSLADILRGEIASPAPAGTQAAPTGDMPVPEQTDATPPADEQVPAADSAPDHAEGAPPAPGATQVPLAALEATRKEKNDFKARAVEFETRLSERDREVAELRKQLDDARKVPAPAAPPQQAQPVPVQRAVLPNPVEDPEGYARAIRQDIEQEQFNIRLNISEQALRGQHQDVDEKIGWFKEAAKQNPALTADLRRQPDPYAWAYQQGKKFHEVREISTNPDAYRARIEAEIRASLAQQTPAAPETKPVPTLPTSLANARSAAERSAPAWTGPEPLSAILKR